jgi:hypothetical protein
MVDPLGATDSVRSTSEVTTNSPALVSEFSEQPLMAGQGTLAEATVPVTTIAIGHGTTTFAAAISQLVSTGLVKLVAPIAGLTFQFGNVSPFSGLGTGIGVGQQPDQVFQTLGRGTINSTLLATVKDVSDRIFAGHVALSPSAADNQGSQRDDVTSSLEWQGIVLAGHRIRRDAIADIAPPPKMVQHAVADLDALDWSFAQMADDAELATDD